MGAISKRRSELSLLASIEAKEEEVSALLQSLGTTLESLLHIKAVLASTTRDCAVHSRPGDEGEEVLVRCLKELGQWCTLALLGFDHVEEPALRETPLAAVCGSGLLCAHAAAVSELQRTLKEKEAALQAAQEGWEQERLELEGRAESLVKTEEAAQRLVKHLKSARVLAVEEGEVRLQDALEEGRRRDACVARLREQAHADMAAAHQKRELELLELHQSHAAAVREAFQRSEAAMAANFRRRYQAVRRELDLKAAALAREQLRALAVEEKLRELESAALAASQAPAEAESGTALPGVEGEGREACPVLEQLEANSLEHAGGRPRPPPPEECDGCRTRRLPLQEAPPLLPPRPHGFAAVLDRLRNISALEEHTSAYIEELGGSAWYYGSQLWSHDPDAAVGFPEEYRPEAAGAEGGRQAYSSRDWSIIPYNASTASALGRWGWPGGMAAEAAPYTCTWARATDCC